MLRLCDNMMTNNENSSEIIKTREECLKIRHDALFRHRKERSKMITAEFLKKKLKNDTPENIYEKIHTVKTSMIHPNPAQPRRDFDDDGIMRLAESIMHYGILQPLTVRIVMTPCDIDGKCARYYELIAGERRLRAAKVAGLREVPCIIVPADDRRSAELAIIENLQREDLNIFEEAEAIQSLINIYSFTQEQAAKVLGISQSAVANKLRLIKLTADEKDLILKNSLTERHARAVLKLSDAEKRYRILCEAASKSLNVSETEQLVDRYFRDSDEEQAKSAKQTVIIKDIRLFYNTLNKAISTIEKAGIGISKEKHDNGDTIEFVIRIDKRIKQESQM